jgi:hypothetical protein
MSGRRKCRAFRTTFLTLFDTFDRTGLKVLAAIANYLGLAPDYFEDTVREGNSVLRLLHYPPQAEPTGEHIRAGAHEDINTITLLLGAEEAGLELLTRDGRWIPVSPKPGELVINIGDMLQRPDQRQATLDVAPGGESGSGPGEPCPLFDALLPALPARFHDRGAARNRARRRGAQMAADQRPRLSPAAPARDQARLKEDVAGMPCSFKTCSILCRVEEDDRPV